MGAAIAVQIQPMPPPQKMSCQSSGDVRTVDANGEDCGAHCDPPLETHHISSCQISGKDQNKMFHVIMSSPLLASYEVSLPNRRCATVRMNKFVARTFALIQTTIGTGTTSDLFAFCQQKITAVTLLEGDCCDFVIPKKNTRLLPS